MSYLKYRIIKQGFLEAENQGKDFDMITRQGSQEWKTEGFIWTMEFRVPFLSDI